MQSNYYQTNSEKLFAQYSSLAADTVHSSWHHLIPDTPGIACDMGAGSGRDSNWLAGMGWDVTAVEPCNELRTLAKQQSHPNICWLDDSLPDLKKLRELGQRFNLILVSAVWMHLPQNQRDRAFRIVSELLAPGGLLVISLRHGPDDDRGFFEIPAEELQMQARDRALTEVHYHKNTDELGRDDVWWETLCFRLPDDGTGSLPLLRHIIVNDNKSSTYKLGLLRTLCRIAEGVPGMVIQRTDDFVDIPFGLIGLYWIKLYLPLITRHRLRQHPSANRGYGFAKDDFYYLNKFSPFDLSVGTTLYGDDAAAIIGAINDCCKNIKEMPANYIRHPGKNSSVFECGRKSVRPNHKAFQLNKESLSAFGRFRIPASLWQSLGQYACWIEPTIVNEWEAIMSGWEASYSKDVYRQALEWNEGKRDTNQVRSRIDDLKHQGDPIHCVWSDKDLRKTNYAVDHCFPWTRWQNNDLWNLMPSSVPVNATKSDKLPSAEQMHHSRRLIIDWWERGYLASNHREKFLVQAEAALPLVDIGTSNTEEIFAAVCYQRTTLKNNQRLAEWSFK
jgi:SAM-dependent methyltransferase